MRLRRHRAKNCVLAAVVAGLAFSPCLPAAVGTINLPSSPSLVAGPNGSTLRGLDLAVELRSLTRPDLWIQLHDRSYVVIDHEWLETRFLPHFKQFLVTLGLPLTPEGLDCDNFVQLFRTQLVLANLLAGGHQAGDVPCALAQVRPENEFGGVPANPAVLHALVVIRTSAGWHVIEPQTVTMAPLHEYPDRGILLTVSL